MTSVAIPREPSAHRDDERLGTVVDLPGRRIIVDGATPSVERLGFRVLSALLSPPGRVISFRELRASCWGDAPELLADIYSVRALVQRLRAKLQHKQEGWPDLAGPTERRSGVADRGLPDAILVFSFGQR